MSEHTTCPTCGGPCRVRWNSGRESTTEGKYEPVDEWHQGPVEAPLEISWETLAATEGERDEALEQVEVLRQQLADIEKGRQQAIDVAAERAGMIAKLQAEASRERKRGEVAERLLHDLTPMGSEFAGDPKRCHDWVQKHMARLYSTVRERTVARREAEQALATERAANVELRRMLTEFRVVMGGQQTGSFHAEDLVDIWLEACAYLDNAALAIDAGKEKQGE